MAASGERKSRKAVLKHWSSLDKPGGFSSADYAAKGLGSAAKGKSFDRDVKKKLESSILFQAHRDLREHFDKRADVATSFGEKWEADLGDLGGQISGKRFGGGSELFLLAIDVFSRKIFARGLENRKGATVRAAFEDIFSSLRDPYPRTPSLLETDAGREFKNSAMAEWCSEKKIRHSIATGANKARMAERAIRSMKRVIMASFQTGRMDPDESWDQIVRKAAGSLNSRYNRSIRMSPDSVELHEKSLRRKEWLRKRLVPFSQFLRDEKKAREGSALEEGLAVGDSVLVPIKKQRRAEIRDKDFHMHYRLLPRRITHILHSQIPFLYKLKNVSTGKSEKRLYYAKELKKVSLPPGISLEDVKDVRVVPGTGLEYKDGNDSWHLLSRL